jgi:DNA-binding IclR family transcriptional regulator
MAPQGANDRGRTRDPVARAFDILRAMVDQGQDVYGVRELAQSVGIPPSSAHRLLSLLENAGMVSREDGGNYALGMEFHRLSMRGASLLPLSKAALPVLERTRRDCGETAVLGIYDSSRREMMFTHSLESENRLRYVLELNAWVPVYAGATGLAIMAFLPDEEQEAIIADTHLAPLTHRTIQDPEVLREQLRTIRERGYAFTYGERVEGAVGFAAPVFDAQRRVVGDIIVTMPEFRFENHHSEQEIGELVVRGARDVTERIGGRLPVPA